MSTSTGPIRRSRKSGETYPLYAAVAIGWVAEKTITRTTDSTVWIDERAAQCNLLRCIFGNPFQPITAAIDPAWLTWKDGIIPRIAQVIYNDRTFEQISVLAHALAEEAAYTSVSMIGHCLDGVQHVRGCYVSDLLLGKR